MAAEHAVVRDTAATGQGRAYQDGAANAYATAAALAADADFCDITMALDADDAAERHQATVDGYYDRICGAIGWSQLIRDAAKGDPGEAGEMEIPEYRARVFAEQNRG